MKTKRKSLFNLVIIYMGMEVISWYSIQNLGIANLLYLTFISYLHILPSYLTFISYLNNNIHHYCMARKLKNKRRTNLYRWQDVYQIIKGSRTVDYVIFCPPAERFIIGFALTLNCVDPPILQSHRTILILFSILVYIPLDDLLYN